MFKSEFEFTISLFLSKQYKLRANSFSVAFLFLKKKKQKNFFLLLNPRRISQLALADRFSLRSRLFSLTLSHIAHAHCQSSALPLRSNLSLGLSVGHK
jgi:hypothetical protein